MTTKSVKEIARNYLEKNHIDCYTWTLTYQPGTLNVKNLVYYENDGMVKGRRHIVPWATARAEVSE